MPAPERILVTGGGGFVGAHLLPRLRTAFPYAQVTSPTATRFDITDRATVEAVVADFKPDACVHLAAIAAIPQARREPEQAWQVNLHGTLNLAAALRAHAPSAVLIYPSSADAYGRSFRSGAPVDETVPLSPMNVYGATKAAAEMALAAMAADGMHVVVLRPFNHSGAGQSPSFVLPAFARQLARIAAGHQPPRMEVGALDPKRDFLDVADVCDAYVAAIARAAEIAPGTILNIASGVPRRIGDVLDQLIALSDLSVEVETGAALLRPNDIPSATGDARLAASLLGWSPRVAWTATLRTVLDDWRVRIARNSEGG